MRQGADRAALKDRANDLYESPREATESLLRCEQWLPSIIWEPCAGRGAIARVLRQAGHTVIAHDLVPHDGADAGIETPIDFLMERRAPSGASRIVSNFPFKNGDDMIRHGLRLGLDVYCLQRLMALEGSGRSDLIDLHLSKVWAGIERLPSMHREGWEGKKVTVATMPYAWFVFSPTPRAIGQPIALRRMSWRNEDAVPVRRAHRVAEAQGNIFADISVKDPDA
jgi:hypothetical protein